MRTSFLNLRRNLLCALLLMAAATLFPGMAVASQGGFTVSVGNEAVTQGSLGSSSIIVTPLNGYTGNISFVATTSSPSLANGCVLMTNYANISGANPATVGNLTVATRNWDCPPNATGQIIGGGTVGEVRQDAAPRRGSGSSKPLEVALSGILLTGLLGVRSHKLRRLACLLVLIALGGFAVGCSTPAPLLTPKGSYVLTVVGTDHDATPNITASTTFTVTIN
ncbi:MAG: Peptidase propeptide [Edaphobacter sp.]|nr:Peptidase propeptide [Edaphobacter sp.]